MAIPGANRPTLGQGMPGGSASLPAGLPLPGGGQLGPPPGNIGAIAVPGARRAGVAQAAPSPGYTAPTVVNHPQSAQAYQEVGGDQGLLGLRQKQDMQQNKGSTKNITVALGILDQVRSGKLKPTKAAKLMQGLTAGDQARLADLVVGRNNREGKTNMDELKALQELQKLPAPSDVEPHDLLTNFARDTSGLITGLPSGIGLAAAYGGRDILNATIPGRKKTSLFKDKILKPVGHQYAETYGPLFHGDFGKFAHNLHEHPVGPILDVASIFSAGVGTAGRIGAAGGAIDAARLASLTEAAVPGARLYHGSSHLGELDPAMGREGGIYLTPHPDVAKLYSGESPLYDRTNPRNIEEMGKTHEVFLPNSAKVFDAGQAITPKIGAIADKITSKESGLLRDNLDRLDPQDHVFLKSLEDFRSKLHSGGFESVDDLRHALVEVNWHDLHSGVDEPGGGVYEKFMQQMSSHLKSEGFSGAKLAAWPGDVREAQGTSGYGLNLGDAAPTHEHLIWDKDILRGASPKSLMPRPKEGVIGRVKGFLDTGPKNNADLANIGKPVPGIHDFGKEVAQGVARVPVKDGLSGIKLATVGTKAFLKAGGKGGLIDLYDRRKGITHEAEIQDTMKQVAAVLDDPDLRLTRRSFKDVVSDVATDIRATREAGKARPGEMAAGLPSFISAGSTGKALSTAETTLREASDLVRAGAIYLRPAYLPNNWAGNTFMNVAHQGVLAPVNLGKSLVLDKSIGVRYTRAMDKSMGANPATVVTSGKGRGYVSSLTQPAAHIMGAAADQPFRRAAWLHEARRAGFSKLSQVKDLFDKAAGGDEAALRQISEIARRAQEEIVKFGNMNAEERSVIRNIVFVYSWMRGAGRFAGRFPLQHPIQTDVFQKISGPGNDYTQSIMGGVPSFMAGVVPIGRGKDGNPIVINPFSLNPLGTGLQLLRAAAGTLDVLRDPKSFNKYAQDDVVGLLNPLLGAYITAREGGPSVKKQLENTIAAMALVKGLKHPGSGNIYPTSRSEAVGHFTLGALYPREADAAAVKKSLERQNIGNPSALIPQEIADFKKATGKEPPYSLVIAYRKDLEDAQIQKDFQSHYADSHGSSGFRNMPAQNRLEAGIDFLRKYGKIKPETINEIERTSKHLTTDAEFNEYANAVWHLTGVGQWKDAWNTMMRSVKGTALTRKKP